MKQERLLPALALRAALVMTIVFGLAACSNAGGGSGSSEEGSSNSFVGTKWGAWNTYSNEFITPPVTIEFTTTTSLTYAGQKLKYTAINSSIARIKSLVGENVIGDFTVKSSDSSMATWDVTSSNAGGITTWKRTSGAPDPYGSGTRVNPIVDHVNVHSITIKNDNANGRVRSSWTSAKAGEKVPLIVEPSVGYLLDAITVTTVETSSTVTASFNNSTCSWEFTMPSACVEVSATFVVDPTRPVGRRDPAVDHINGHSINVKSGIANGSVRSDWASASPGEIVPLTVTPANGYRVESVTVTTVESAPAVTAAFNSSKGQWEFTMPSACVEVSATFVLN